MSQTGFWFREDPGQPGIQPLNRGKPVNGMEEGCQEKGEVDTAITNDGACKGHEGTDQEHSRQGEYDTKYGEGVGSYGEGLEWPGPDRGDRPYYNDCPDQHQLQ